MAEEVREITGRDPLTETIEGGRLKGCHEHGGDEGRRGGRVRLAGCDWRSESVARGSLTTRVYGSALTDAP